MKFDKPGMRARTSGIYEAVHANSHRLEHELTIAEGVVFPVCRRCGHRVRFRLLQPVREAEQGWAPFGVLFESYRNEPQRKLRLKAA